MTGSAEPPAPRTAEATDLLRLDYQQTIGLLAGISDVRFKLLALVPTLSGAAVAVLGRPSSTAELLAVGLIGLIATLGVLLYELRNTQLYDYGLRRAQWLERELGLGSMHGAGRAGRPLLRPPRQDAAAVRRAAGRPRRGARSGLQRRDRGLDVSLRVGSAPCTRGRTRTADRRRARSCCRSAPARRAHTRPPACGLSRPGVSATDAGFSSRGPGSWASRSASARTAAPAAGRSSR